MELSLSADLITTQRFNWNTTLNFSRNINTVEQLANNATELIHADFDGNAAQVRSVVGRPMGDIYAHPVATTESGQMIVGANGLYELDADNWEVYGNALPDFEGGLVSGLQYNNITLNFVADFSYGGSIMPTGVYWMTSRGLTEESLNYMDAEHGGLRYYVDGEGQGVQTTGEQGPNGELVFNDGMLLEGVTASGQTNTNVVSQATYYNGTYNWGGPQYGNSRYELYVQENNWVKVRELALGFNLPKTWISGIGMQNANFSVYGRKRLFYLPLHQGPGPRADHGRLPLVPEHQQRRQQPVVPLLRYPVQNQLLMNTHNPLPMGIKYLLLSACFVLIYASCTKDDFCRCLQRPGADQRNHG